MQYQRRIISVLLSIMIAASSAVFTVPGGKAVESVNKMELKNTETTTETYKSKTQKDVQTVAKTDTTVNKDVKSTSSNTSTLTQISYYGSYYDDIGGLESLIARKDSDGILQDLRALIDYSSNSAKTTLGTTISGTDKDHPTYSGTSSGSLAYWYRYAERGADDANSGFKLFYSQDYTTAYTSTTVWNREHVWPQSLSGGLFGTTGAGSDLHHVRPSYIKDNSARSNYPYGNVTTVTKYVYANGDTSSYVVAKMEKTSDNYIFEPDDSYKGDVARILAYMITHYESLYSLLGNVIIGGTDTLVEWNALDPVDDVELNRNNTAYKAQGNRNPYIDAPELIDIIWGDGIAEKCTVTQNLTYVSTSNPTKVVTKGEAFSTVLTPYSGCTMESVAVTMGDSDVTSLYYNSTSGAINIPQVTDNVVITAVAYNPTPDVEPQPGDDDSGSDVNGGSQRFVQISSKNDLKDGDKIIITFDDSKAAALSSISNKALDVTTVTTNDNGILYTNNENIMWTVTDSYTSDDVLYFKLRSVANESVYLSHEGSNSSSVALLSSGDTLFTANGNSTNDYVIKNLNDNNRFLGSQTATFGSLKWYAVGNMSTYYHDTLIYRYEDSGNPYNYTMDDEGITITGTTLGSKEISIPEYINDTAVVAIGDSAFSGCVANTIIVPSTVTYIGDSAFEGCKNLLSVELPQTITHIGNRAFADCVSLESISLPQGVVEYGEYLFSGCTALLTVTLPEDLQLISTGWFDGCTLLADIFIPEGVQTISAYAFRNCTEIRSIELPTNLSSVGVSAFEGCSSLKNIAIPSGVVSLGNYSFRNCTLLKRAAIYSTGVSFGAGAFDNASEGFCIYGYEGSTAQLYLTYNYISLTDINYFGLKKQIKKAEALLNLRGANFTTETKRSLMEAVDSAYDIMEQNSADRYEIDLMIDYITECMENL